MENQTNLKWRIMLVDDDFQVLRGMRSVIPWDELQAEYIGDAISGEEGLELAQRHDPDIIITDLYMPGMNGIDMIQQLRETGFQGSIIILSGYSDFEHARKALSLGVDDYLTKPVTVEAIQEVLSRVINKMEEAALYKLEHSELKKSIKAYESMLMQEWMYSVISGTRFDRYSEFTANTLTEQWQGQKHVVSVIEVVNTERIRGISLSDWNLFKFAVNNVIDEFLALHWPDSQFLQLYGYHFALLLHDEKAVDSHSFRNRAVQLGEQIVSCLQDVLELKARVGIGTVKEEWTKVHNSTDEAFQTLLYHQFDWNEPSELPSSFMFYQKLNQAIETLDDVKIMEVIQGYFNEMERQHTFRLDGFYSVIAAEIWAIFQYSLYQSGNAMMMDETISITDFDRITSREKLEAWILTKIIMYCKQKKPSVNPKHKQAVDFMMEYIHQHYGEDITLEDLANRLYISKNYLNQLFKKVTGETFMNYVIRVRMQQAKALLVEGKLMVYEVSEKVGYQNVPYFSTLFKKFWGVNPSDCSKHSGHSDEM